MADDTLLLPTRNEPTRSRIDLPQSLWLWLNAQSIGDRPTNFETASNSVLGPTKIGCPFADRHALAIVSQFAVGAAVIALLFSSCPPCVARPVISFDIRKAIERHSLWPFAHVSEEIRKHPPTLANFDSPSSISNEMASLGIGASLDHREPRTVSRRDRSAITRMTMPRYSFHVEAAARSVPTGTKIASPRDDCFSAIAFAAPGNPFAFVRGSINNDEPRESLPTKVH